MAGKLMVIGGLASGILMIALLRHFPSSVLILGGLLGLVAIGIFINSKRQTKSPKRVGGD